MWWWSLSIHRPTNFHGRLDTSQNTFFSGRLHSTRHWTKPFTTEGILYFSWWKLSHCNTRLKVCSSLLFLKLYESAISCVELCYFLLDSNMMNRIPQSRPTGVSLIFHSYSQQRRWLIHFWPSSQIRKLYETLHYRSIISYLSTRRASICLFNNREVLFVSWYNSCPCFW